MLGDRAEVIVSEIEIRTTKPQSGTDHARRVVGRLLSVGQHVTDDVRRDILALSAAAVPPLLEILEDDRLAPVESPGAGWAPAHAARLLGDLRATDAVEPMLRMLAKTDGLDVLHDRILQSLPEIGEAVIEPALRAYVEDADLSFRDGVAAVLAEVRIHDDRIFEILVDQLHREPSRGAGNLAIYGDSRGVPHLLAALDEYEIVKSESPLANHALLELRAAIEELGGTLNAEQQLKCRRGREPAEVFRSKMDALFKRRGHDVVPVRGSPRPGRNDPCWCGSAKKYKKCHLLGDESNATTDGDRSKDVG